MMIFVQAILIGFLMFAVVGKAQTIVKVPRGKPIMIDSRITENEWTDTKSIVVSGEVKLHFKQSGEYVFICIDAPDQPYLTTDTYLSNDGEIYNLHVSAMLGERILQNGEFTAWDWWNNKDWTANAARILNTVEPKRFLPNNAIEFQISRRRFRGKKWLMKFDIGIPNRTSFPAGTIPKNTGKWLTVELGKPKFK